MPNLSFEYGNVVVSSLSSPSRLLDSKSVISSPKIFEILPRFISSMIR
nr:hypothetical protein [Francisella hispaniensis]